MMYVLAALGGAVLLFVAGLAFIWWIDNRATKDAG